MTPITTAIWQKNSKNNEWFDFLRLKIDAPYFSNERKGVFLLWYVAPGSPKVIKVGSGVLGDHFRRLRSDPQVLEFSKSGPLKISWVSTNGVLKDDQMAGVEAFLYNTYTPLIGEKNPATPIPINLL